MSIELKVKKLDSKAVIPKFAYEGDACFDLVATSRIIDPLNSTVTYGTGLAFEIPDGYVGTLYPRSSICNKDLILSNGVGQVDAKYRGEIKAVFRISRPAAAKIYEIGERIIQMRLEKLNNVNIVETNELTSTERGNGGFGSSGK